MKPKPKVLNAAEIERLAQRVYTHVRKEADFNRSPIWQSPRNKVRGHWYLAIAALAKKLGYTIESVPHDDARP